MVGEHAIIESIMTGTASDEALDKRTPERDLLVAILQRAFLDYFGNQTPLRIEAANWMFEEPEEVDERFHFESPNSMFTFRWICQQLDLNAEVLVDQLKKMAFEAEQPNQKYFQMRRRA